VSPGDVVVLPDQQGLAETVARDLLERLSQAQERGEVPQIGLTGGSVADAVHREVARLSLTPDPVEPAGHDEGGPVTRVDWSRVDVFWGDERFVPPDDAERNEKQAREALLDHVGVDPERVHAMPSTADAGDVHAAAVQYAARLRAHGSGAFEVLMLGLGPDGHLASLFPGHREVGVHDTPVVGVTGSPKPPPERISLTLPALARTRALWFMVSGGEKAEAVARTREATVGADEAPGVALLSAPEVRWYLDDAAAGRG